MNIKSFIKDDDAVSPVIGVILMVAITVILAAVIGAFVLGIGGDQSVAPQASWSVDEASEEITFTHDGGDSIEADNVALTVGSTSEDVTDLNSPSYSSGDDITAGNQIAGDVSNDGYSSGDFSDGNDARITWEDPDSDDSNVLRTHTLNNQ